MAQDLTEKSNRSGTSRSVESLLRVGARIRGLRRSHGLTQEELAHRSNLTKGFISQLERDLTSPSLESLLEILETLDTDIVRFFQGHQEGRIVFGEGDLRNAATYPEVRAFELMVPGAANRNMESAPRDDGTGRVGRRGSARGRGVRVRLEGQGAGHIRGKTRHGEKRRVVLFRLR